jgi:hypothetical protein
MTCACLLGGGGEMAFARAFARVTCLGLCFFIAQSFAANLLSDPGFEASVPAVFGPAWVLTSASPYDFTISADGIHNNTGSVGTFLGNPDSLSISSLQQVVFLTPGDYVFSFYWRNYMSNEAERGNDPNIASLTAYIGPAPATFTGGVSISTDPQATTPWTLVALPTFNVAVAGNYYVGWQWANFWGEYSVDDVSLDQQVPEPSTFALVLVPAAWLIYRRRKA